MKYSVILKIVLWILFAAWYGFILYLSSIPNLRMVADTKTDETLRVPAHLVEYFVLAVLFIMAAAVSFGKKPPLYIFFVLLALSLADELWQSTIPTRTFQLKDLMWDNVGNAIALAIALKLPITKNQ